MTTSSFRPIPNDQKLCELVLWLATASEGDAPFGKVKLNKLLFYADFDAYLRFGAPITGHVYQKLEWGPAPRRLLTVFPALGKPPKKDPNLAVRMDDYHGLQQQRPFALRVPDTSVFSSAELHLADEVVKRYWGKTAREVSDLSHEFVGYNLVGLGDDIPYQLALIGSRELTEYERRIGLALSERAARCLGIGAGEVEQVA